MWLRGVSCVRIRLCGVSGVRMWLGGVRMWLGGVRMWLDGREPGLRGGPPCSPELAPSSAAAVAAGSLLLGHHRMLQAGKETTYMY